MCYTGATSKVWVANQFATDTKLQTEVKKFFNYKSYADDVIQDILLQILSQKKDKEDKLLDACINNRFDVWLFAILKNQKRNISSYTNQHYVNTLEEQTDYTFERSNNHSVNEFDKTEQKEHKQYLIDLLKKELILINKKNWYNSAIFQRYVDEKEKYRLEGKNLTVKEFGEKLNIHKDSLWQVINKVKQKLYNKIKNEL